MSKQINHESLPLSNCCQAPLMASTGNARFATPHLQGSVQMEKEMNQKEEKCGHCIHPRLGKFVHTAHFDFDLAFILWYCNESKPCKNKNHIVGSTKTWEERFDEKFNVWKDITITPRQTGDFEKAKILQEFHRNTGDRIKAFISQVEAEAYERGKEEGSRGHHGRKMYLLGRQELLAEIIGIVEGMYPPTCDCTGANYECEHWGTHETIDKLITKLQELKNK